MADARLQRRRRVHDQGLDARVAFLHERMRSGQLTRERIDLAAYLGDAASRALVSSPDLDLEAWLQGLLGLREPKQLKARLAIGAARTCLPLWDPELPSVIPTEVPEPATHQAWCVALGTASVVDYMTGMHQVRSRGNPLRGIARAEAALLFPSAERSRLLRAEADGLHGSIGGKGRRVYSLVANAVAHALWTVLGLHGSCKQALDQALLCVGRVKLRKAIRDELVPWILDRGDPVLARVGQPDSWA